MHVGSVTWRPIAFCSVILITALLTIALTACAANTNAPSTSQAEDIIDQKNSAKELSIIGTQREGAQEILLTNDLDVSLSTLSIKRTGEVAYGDSLLAKDQRIEAGEEVRMFLDELDATATYDVRVTKASNGGELEFLDIPLPTVSLLTLKVSGEIPYVDYVTVTNEEGSTKDSAFNKGQESNESEPSSTPVQVDQPVEDTPSQESSEQSSGVDEYVEVIQDYGSSNYYYEAPSAPVVAPIENAPVQTEDECAPDLILR